MKRKIILTVITVLAMTLLPTAFAQTIPTLDTPTDTAAYTDVTEPTDIITPTENPVDAVDQSSEIQETLHPVPSISDEPMTLAEMNSLRFFDTDRENVLCFASSTANTLIIKQATGTVVYVEANELRVEIPELNNEFCFNCADVYTEQIGDEVTIWMAVEVND